ncbi:cilia- and flagella-associated protein 53 [Drosophila tropicalis]|uniref:cilia- and flagella-associated protein 53 n=1 Tax=Drosophila tropicalis TaxID=46794 RepID=UPI0035AB8983
MQNSGRGDEHFHFIQQTDRKSLHTQIGLLVKKAQDVAAQELSERSIRLKDLLESEDKSFEKEFAHKVKTRIDEDINERSKQLHAIREQDDIIKKKILEEKRIQQVMLNCYEIREAQRLKNLKETKICQAEQIEENQRKKYRECQVEQFWFELDRRRWAQFECEEEYEKRRREQMKERLTQVLDVQVGELETKREEERQEKRQEAEKLAKILEEIRHEKFVQENSPANPDKSQYREELLKEIRRKQCAKLAELEAEKIEHIAFCRETERLEEEARSRIAQSKKDLKRATHEYLSYVQRMRRLEMGIEKMMDDRTADLYHVDICTKSNIAEMTRLKREEASRCHDFLRQQICEEAERRLRLEAEVRENKMPENRFVHPPVSREKILDQKRKNRADLDAQIIEMKRVQEEETKRYNDRLLKALIDPMICQQLATEYMLNGTDYLKPHPNWKIYACSTNNNVLKPSSMEKEHVKTKTAEVNERKCQIGDMPPERPPQKNQTNVFKSCNCKMY